MSQVPFLEDYCCNVTSPKMKNRSACGEELGHGLKHLPWKDWQIREVRPAHFEVALAKAKCDPHMAF